MHQPLILCVPNFSEGRRPRTIARLAEAVRGVPGAFLLDRHTDRDHHRTVLTIAGPPAAVVEAAFQAARTARALIDLRRHRGEHPRIGATDVIPLVPLQEISMERCVALARALGRRIGRELGIPIFLYEEAASRPARRRLEMIRRGGMAGLAARMADHPAWKPDFGPPRPHVSAGVTVVGARLPLIAYNVNLASRDLASAQEIARTIRASTGGLASVKAIGLFLASKGIVQVSMNLVDYLRISPYDAFLAVQAEAEKRGIAIESSELVGLVPLDALVRSAKQACKLRRFERQQVLEARLERALAEEMRVNLGPSARSRAAEPRSQSGRIAADFLAAVSAARPTPGGGSVAAMAAASAAALGVKACGVTARSSRSTAAQKRRVRPILLRLRGACRRLDRLVDADAAAYATLAAARRLKRPTRIPLRRATELPLRVAELALGVAGELRRLLDEAAPSVLPDLRVGYRLALAAGHGAVHLVGENLQAIENTRVKSDLQRKQRRLRQELVEAGEL